MSKAKTVSHDEIAAAVAFDSGYEAGVTAAKARIVAELREYYGKSLSASEFADLIETDRL